MQNCGIDDHVAKAAKHQHTFTKLEDVLTDDFEKSLANFTYYQDEVHYGKDMAEKLYPMGKDGRRTVAKDYMKMRENAPLVQWDVDEVDDSCGEDFMTLQNIGIDDYGTDDREGQGSSLKTLQSDAPRPKKETGLHKNGHTFGES
jgi:hypothetical protein